ncbi:unnamed protein product [Zymoseptoria tritici ST99CH_1E4]|uniref:Uncharacterized protein n=1 Tax=Zymoseptoria tritici ST99CH_1E4 TaxID=1276532 RepID=A0A2H1GZ17_ZYMTR|nr:unnamed protein product [Zymoseptoria tritici ST99CH_1E4]
MSHSMHEAEPEEEQRRVFLTQVQEQRRRVFEASGFLGIINAIQEQNADSIGVGTKPLSWKKDALWLLCQLSRDEMGSVFKTSILQEISEGRAGHRMLLDADSGLEFDTKLCVSYITDWQGKGLGRLDFETLIQAMEVGIRVDMNEQQFVRDGLDLIASIERSCAAFEALDVATLSATVTQWTLAARADLRAAEVEGTSYHVPRFQISWRGTSTHGQGNARPPKLDASMYACVVLHHLWPLRGFEVRNFALFSIAHESQAAVAEELTRWILCDKISSDPIKSIEGSSWPKDNGDWARHRRALFESGVLANIEPNMLQIRARQKWIVATAKDAEYSHERRALVHELTIQTIAVRGLISRVDMQAAGEMRLLSRQLEGLEAQVGKIQEAERNQIKHRDAALQFVHAMRSLGSTDEE